MSKDSSGKFSFGLFLGIISGAAAALYLSQNYSQKNFLKFLKKSSTTSIPKVQPKKKVTLPKKILAATKKTTLPLKKTPVKLFKSPKK